MEFINQDLISAYNCPEGVNITGKYKESYATTLTNSSLRFLANLHRKFNTKRKKQLQLRLRTQQAFDNGSWPSFLDASKEIRNSEWTVSPVPPDLLNRRVEITGPTSKKTIIDSLNSGANVFMADFEDTNTPTWENMIEGQVNLRDTINKTITYEHSVSGKRYQLKKEVATLMIRPRGWHLEEWNIWIDGEPMSASLVDFGLYFFHNVKTLVRQGSGPYFYLPKIENHQEAKLWNEVFVFAQDYMGFSQKTIKATVLIETITAAFEMHEILYELREHSAGLNCGRWDYLFSFIKKFKNMPHVVFPDREQVTMQSPFMRAYTQLLIQTCHRRGVHAIGGMSPQIPIRENLSDSEAILKTVKEDKRREVRDGHDGTWVAHSELVEVAKSVFDEYMPGKNQISNKRTDLEVTEEDLLAIPKGSITEVGLRENIKVAIMYLESWLNGNGMVAINQLMEDTATAEISRTQIWQWIHNCARLEDGRMITLEYYKRCLLEEVDKMERNFGSSVFNSRKFTAAIHLFDQLIQSEELPEFLTLPAYELVV
ncbi:MAG: malate synthase [Polaribacter sp.]|jgi:malate synthase